MSFNRRDILKFLSAGSVIAPVVNGLTSESDRFRLIEPPKVELAPPPKIVEAKEIPNGEYDATIYLRRRDTGKVTRWDCQVNAVDLYGGLQVGVEYTDHSGRGKKLFSFQ